MKRILIVKLSAIGDIIMSSAILPALRRAYPDAHVAWLSEEFGASMLCSNPMVDECIVLPRQALRLKQLRNPRKWLRTLLAMRKRLRDGRYDLVIDTHGLLKSAVWAWMSGCRRRVALEPEEFSYLLCTERVDPGIDPKGRLCHQYRAVSEYMGWPAEPFSMSIVPAPEAAAKAASRMEDNGAESGPILLMPFTTRPQKHWFEDRWASLAQALTTRYNRQVWILGGPGDEETALRIAAMAEPTKVQVVAGPGSDLQEKMGILEHSPLAIGVDTGITHMSLALGTPTIAIFGSTIPYRETAPTPGIVLYKDMPCSPCHRHPTCNGKFPCLGDITVDEVMEAASKLMIARSE